MHMYAIESFSGFGGATDLWLPLVTLLKSCTKVVVVVVKYSTEMRGVFRKLLNVRELVHADAEELWS
jgi:hypothetical protein